MKGNNSISDELLTVLSQWYEQTVKGVAHLVCAEGVSVPHLGNL